MDILRIIKTRRSIRKYRDKSIADKLIAKILEAGRWAPSGLNNQPWRFMIVQNMVRKNQLSDFSKYSRIIKDSAALILVFADKRVIYNRDKDLMAIGASIQNMLLAACSLGIGACWLGEILSKKKKYRTMYKYQFTWN
ncbi:MAG: nitroreductase family protein [bacterium]|nr:nitroreductase family protein [bacterium]